MRPCSMVYYYSIHMLYDVEYSQHHTTILILWRPVNSLTRAVKSGSGNLTSVYKARAGHKVF